MVTQLVKTFHAFCGTHSLNRSQDPTGGSV